MTLDNHLFSLEIWVSIGKKLTKYTDVVNLCYVFEFLYDFFVDVMAERGYKEVMKPILKQNVLTITDVLALRLVSKGTKPTIDKYYSKRNFKNLKYQIWNSGSRVQYPRAVLNMPLTDSERTKLLEYVESGANSFYAGRLLIRFGRRQNPLPSRSVTEAFRNTRMLWKNVRHLEIIHEKADVDGVQDPAVLLSQLGGFNSVFGAMFRRMKKLKTFSSKLPCDVTTLMSLPHLDKLEAITVKSLYNETLNSWISVLRTCGENLRHLHARYLTEGLQIAMKNVTFKKMKEFKTDVYIERNDQNQSIGMGEMELNDNRDDVLDVNRASNSMDVFQVLERSRFCPKLRRLCIPFESWMGFSDPKPEYFLRKLIVLSHKLKNSLSHIEIEFRDDIDVVDIPKAKNEIHGSGSSTVTKLVIRPYAPFQWALLLAIPFANLRHLHVQDDVWDRSDIARSIGEYAENAVVDIGAGFYQNIWTVLPKLETFTYFVGTQSKRSVTRSEYERIKTVVTANDNPKHSQI